MDYTLPIVENRVDWCTLTCAKGERRAAFQAFARDVAAVAAKGQMAPRPWRWRGYDGATVQGLTYGSRDDSDIVQLSGPLADEWLDVAWARADHCTRIDLAVTLGEAKNCDELIRQHLAEAKTERETKGTGPDCHAIYSFDRAETFYLGSRESDLFFRAYDKYAESGDDPYRDCFRYELEVKGEPAQRTVAWLCSSADRGASIRQAVYSHLSRRGIRPLFSHVDTGMRIQTIRPRTDRASRLGWLSATVRPVVQRLMAEGPVEEVAEALGIPLSLSERWKLRTIMQLGRHRDELQEWGISDVN